MAGDIVAGLGFAPGSEGMLVFRATSAVALIGYATSSVDSSIWVSPPPERANFIRGGQRLVKVESQRDLGGIDVRSWHFSDIQPALTNVRFWGAKRT